MSSWLKDDDYVVAWIALTPAEEEIAVAVLEKRHEGSFAPELAETYSYKAGEINSINIVIATLSDNHVRQAGAAALIVNHVQARFTNIRFALLVGAAEGSPRVPDLEGSGTQRVPHHDIRLGDVLVCIPDLNGGGFRRYDLNEALHSTKPQKYGVYCDLPVAVRSAISRIQMASEKPFQRGLKLATLLEQFQDVAEDENYFYPGTDEDDVYVLSDFEDPANPEEPLVPTTRVERGEREHPDQPQVWYGSIGSGDAFTYKTSVRRCVSNFYGLIGYELACTGSFNLFPVMAVRGVSRYGGQRELVSWEAYATSVAAIYAKGILLSIEPHVLLANSVPVLKYLPVLRNRNFVERTQISSRLDELLPLGRVSQTAALTGRRGIGKSQIALEFAWRRHQDNDVPVFWVNADSYQTFYQGYKCISKVLGLSPDLEGDELLAAVCSWFEVRKDWLLVFDNLETRQLPDYGLIPVEARSILDCLGYVPSKGQGSILFTTSSRDMVEKFVDENCILEVERMNEHQAVQLLDNICEPSVTNEDSKYTSMMLGHLEGHPLSIHLAAMCVKHTSISKEEYVTLLEEKNAWHEALITNSSTQYQPGAIAKSVLSSWRVTIDYLVDRDPRACGLLEIMAYWHDTDMPWPLLLRAWNNAKRADRRRTRGHRTTTNQSRDLDQEISSTVEEEPVENQCCEYAEACIHINVAIELLRELGLISSTLGNQETRFYHVNKVIQELMKDKNLLGKDSRALHAGYTAVAAVMYGIRAGNWTPSSNITGDNDGMYLHVMNLFQQPKLWSNSNKSLDRLKKTAAWLVNHRRLSDAEELLTRALHRSESMHRRKRKRGETIARPSDLDTLATVDVLVQLAIVYEQRAQYGTLIKTLKRVVRARRRLLGKYDPSTMDATIALATHYGKQGNPKEEAKLKYQTLCFKVKGNSHGKAGEPELLSDLIKLFDELEQHDEAEEMKLCFLEHCKTTWGQKHEHTVSAWVKLGRTYHKQKRYHEAEGIQSFVVDLRKEMYGEKNLNTIGSLEDLASTYEAQDKYSEQEDIVAEVYEMYKNWLGELHPYTAISKLPVAVAQFRQKRYDEAESTILSIISSGHIVLGLEHPTMQACSSFLGRICLQQGRPALAEGILASLVKIEQRALGEQVSQSLLTNKFHLGKAHFDQQHILEAESIFEEILPQQESILGTTHLDTLTTMRFLGLVYVTQRRHHEAKELIAQLRARSREVFINEADDPYADLDQLMLETSEKRFTGQTSDPPRDVEDESGSDIVTYTPSPTEGTPPSVSEIC